MTLGDGGLETEVETEKLCPPSAPLHGHRPLALRARSGRARQAGHAVLIRPALAYAPLQSRPRKVARRTGFPASPSTLTANLTRGCVVPPTTFDSSVLPRSAATLR